MSLSEGGEADAVIHGEGRTAERDQTDRRQVTVVSEVGGNLIVNVKDSRVAIGKDMANRILV